jgi:FkbM family methyltransferase
MFSDKIEIRYVDVAGETGWYWIKGDTGAFEGPKRDWIDHHSTKYFTYVKKFDTIVSAGTNCGMYARMYSKMFKHVYAFEPEPIAFHCMVNNCPFDNVIKLNAALGNGHGLVGIHRASPGGDNMNVGMNVVTNPSEQFKIPMMTIDSLVLDSCDIIQLDVEGFEKYAILGAIETIKKYKPVIIAERFVDDEKQAFMNQLGYHLVTASSMDAIYVHKDNR